MQALQGHDLSSRDSHAMDQLHDFLRQRREASEPVEDFEYFEQELHRLFVMAEREALGEELARFDLDVPQIEVEGRRYSRVLRGEKTYTSAAGPVRVERSLYRASEEERAICPLDLRVGMIEGHWTPLAAKQATWAVAHLTPQESEELFELIGNMAPSKSALDRLPKNLSRHWEARRVRFEEHLRQQGTIPREAVSMAISLDGVMAPMKDGRRQAKRQRARSKGKAPRGPSGYQEVGYGKSHQFESNTLSMVAHHHAACQHLLLSLHDARRNDPTRFTLNVALSESKHAASRPSATAHRKFRQCAEFSNIIRTFYRPPANLPCRAPPGTIGAIKTLFVMIRVS